MSDGGRARWRRRFRPTTEREVRFAWRRRFRPTTEREVRFAKLTVKLLLAAEVKQDATVQLCELRCDSLPLQVVSQIIARMVAGIENDAREPHEILADGAEHFVNGEWWAEFTAVFGPEPEAFWCGDPDFDRFEYELERLDYRLP